VAQRILPCPVSYAPMTKDWNLYECLIKRIVTMKNYLLSTVISGSNREQIHDKFY